MSQTSRLPDLVQHGQGKVPRSDQIGAALEVDVDLGVSLLVDDEGEFKLCPG